MRLPRAAGVLLHPTSLPGPHGSGDLGEDARRFVDWLESSGQRYWQILPLGGIGPGNSPYMSSSAFAGNELLVSLDELHRQGWLTAGELEAGRAFDSRRIDFGRVAPFRFDKLALAAQRFFAAADPEKAMDFESFCQKHSSWLDDYALFMSLARENPGLDWCDWDLALATRQPAALAAATRHCHEQINFWKFCQWCFFRQWGELRAYANRRGIKIIGDAPIFIAYQSAEAWSRPDLFEFDKQGRQKVVAGVPPDYFSANGQRWGNPLYRWGTHQRQGFSWWIERLRHSLELVDLLRIDHFIGFTRYWEIPASEPDAQIGRWRHAPGDALFETLRSVLGEVPIIAEDLGSVTPAVDALRKKFRLPGMCVLQFAWGPEGEQKYLPHNHQRDRVVYTGTHDNDTTLGWWDSLSEAGRHHLREYLATDARLVHYDLIRCAMASVVDTAVIPFQDLVGLDGSHRMNHPGRGGDNWSWRMQWTDIADDLSARLAHSCRLYGRDPSAGA